MKIIFHTLVTFVQEKLVSAQLVDVGYLFKWNSVLRAYFSKMVWHENRVRGMSSKRVSNKPQVVTVIFKFDEEVNAFSSQKSPLKSQIRFHTRRYFWKTKWEGDFY